VLLEVTKTQILKRIFLKKLGMKTQHIFQIFTPKYVFCEKTLISPSRRQTKFFRN